MPKNAGRFTIGWRRPTNLQPLARRVIRVHSPLKNLRPHSTANSTPTFYNNPTHQISPTKTSSRRRLPPEEDSLLYEDSFPYEDSLTKTPSRKRLPYKEDSLPKKTPL